MNFYFSQNHLHFSKIWENVCYSPIARKFSICYEFSKNYEKSSFSFNCRKNSILVIFFKEISI